MFTGPKPPPTKADMMYSAPRNHPPYSSDHVPAVRDGNYSPNVPTPGGTTETPNPKQGKMPM